MAELLLEKGYTVCNTNGCVLQPQRLPRIPAHDDFILCRFMELSDAQAPSILGELITYLQTSMHTKEEVYISIYNTYSAETAVCC